MVKSCVHGILDGHRAGPDLGMKTALFIVRETPRPFRIGRLSAVRPSLVLRLRRYHGFFGWCKLSKLPVAAFIPALSLGSSHAFMTGEK